jgi:hypothetical protein
VYVKFVVFETMEDGKRKHDTLQLFHLLLNESSSQDQLLTKRQLISCFALSAKAHQALVEKRVVHLKCFTSPKDCYKSVAQLVGEDGDCTLDEWLHFTENLYQQNELHKKLSTSFQSIKKSPLLPFSVPPLKSKRQILRDKKRQQERQKRQEKEMVVVQRKQQQQQRQQQLQNGDKKETMIRGGMRTNLKKEDFLLLPPTPPPPTSSSLEDDLMFWLKELHLSNRSIYKSSKYWRRNFANGYLYAEILLYHAYQSVYFMKPAHLRGPQIILSAFDPYVSATSKMKDNWLTLLVLLKRIGIRLKLDDMIITRIMKAREGVAKILLESIYRNLLRLSLAPETTFMRNGDKNISLDVSIGNADIQPTAPVIPRPSNTSPRKLKTKNRKRSRSNSVSLLFVNVGHVSKPIQMNGEVQMYGNEIYKHEEVAVSVGVLPS